MISRALNLFFISLLSKRPKLLVLEIKEYLLDENVILANDPGFLEQSKNCDVTFLELKVANDKICIDDKEFDGVLFGRSAKKKSGVIPIVLRSNVSREHGVIFLENNVLRYADKSANGSFVQNASKKSRRIEVHNSTLELQNNDVIMIGKTPAAAGKYFYTARVHVFLR